MRPLLIAVLATCGLSAQEAESRPKPSAGAVAPPSQAGPESKAPQRNPFVRGRLASRYWLRWAGGESDQDLYETLTLDFANKSTDAVTGHFMGRLTADLDGSEDGASPFFQIQDTSSTAVTGLVYDAHADLHRVPGFEVVRVGRQFLNETPEYVLFDGALAATKPWGAANVQFSAYGGMTTHLYEQSESGDWTFGLFSEGRAWEGSWWRLDWMHL